MNVWDRNRNKIKKTKQVSYASKRSETDGNILHSLKLSVYLG